MTLVDTETGEIVTSVALAIPRPAEVVDVYDLCVRVELMICGVDDVGQVAEAKARFAAIDTYLTQTSKDGRSRIAATMRRLETRIGDLIGDPERGGDHGNQHSGGKSVATDLPLSRNEKREFRLMAANRDVVEAVISDSDDSAPASRKKVLAAIRVHQQTTKEQDVDTRLDKTTAGVVARVAQAREMAATGHTSKQIASAIGITFDSMDQFRKRHGIDVPADQVVGKSGARFDPVRVVSAAVHAVDGIGMLFDQIDYSTLPFDQIDGWVSVLDDSIRSLTTLRKHLKEQTQP